MQNWYNNLIKGQRIVIWSTLLVIGFIIGAAVGEHLVVAITGSLIALAPCIYFELGKRKV